MYYDNVYDPGGNDNYDAQPGMYQPDAWGRAWGHPDYGKDPADLLAPQPPTAGPTGSTENTAAPGPAPAPPPSSTPQPTTTPPPSGGGGGDYGDFAPEGFEWPSLALPRFEAPPEFSYPEFSYGDFAYDDFAAPSLEDAYAEPGYDFARKEGLRAITNSASAQGATRTGGTLKDLMSWGNRFAEQNYGNVFNRKATSYGMNRGNAFGNYQTNRDNAFGNWQANRGNAADNYMTNYGVSRDTFDRNTNAVRDEFQPRQRQAEMTFEDLYRRWREELNANTSIATAGAGL